MGSVTPLRGGAVAQSVRNEGCVKHLKDLLEKAENGEIVGIVCASLHGDALASYTIAGLAGPYSLLGAVTMAQKELQDMMVDHFQ